MDLSNWNIAIDEQESMEDIVRQGTLIDTAYRTYEESVSELRWIENWLSLNSLVINYLPTIFEYFCRLSNDCIDSILEADSKLENLRFIDEFRQDFYDSLIVKAVYNNPDFSDEKK